jgi:hypothetical protein
MPERLCCEVWPVVVMGATLQAQERLLPTQHVTF